MPLAPAWHASSAAHHLPPAPSARILLQPRLPGRLNSSATFGVLGVRFFFCCFCFVLFFFVLFFFCFLLFSCFFVVFCVLVVSFHEFHRFSYVYSGFLDFRMLLLRMVSSFRAGFKVF